MASPGGGGGNALSFGLLILRLAAGGMLLYGHGWGKLMHYSERAPSFGNPIGLGSPVSMGLVIFAEVFCAICVMLGFATRIAAFFPAFALGVAGLIHHAQDPFQRKELALLYCAVFVALMLAGGGRYALDAKFGPKLRFGGGK